MKLFQKLLLVVPVISVSLQKNYFGLFEVRIWSFIGILRLVTKNPVWLEQSIDVSVKMSVTPHHTAKLGAFYTQSHLCNMFAIWSLCTK